MKRTLRFFALTLAVSLGSVVVPTGVEAQYPPGCTVRYDLGAVVTASPTGVQFNTPLRIDAPVPTVTSQLSATYPAANLVDGDQTTAWIEGVRGYGEGQRIRFALTERPYAIGIRPGYQKSEALHVRNGRPHRLRISYLGGPGSGMESADTAIVSCEITLMRGTGFAVPMQEQFVYIGYENFAFNMAMEMFQFLEIEILSVDSQGASDPDTAISEITLYGAGEVIGESWEGM